MKQRKSRRESILDAAADIVRKKGAAHMTLDAVSRRAHVSKGGLLYHFKTKEMLLEAMVLRLRQSLASIHEREFARLSPSAAQTLKAHVISMMVLQQRDIKTIAALLAAGVHDPNFLKQVKITTETIIRDMQAADFSLAFTRVVIFASLGLLLSEMLGISASTVKERKAFFNELVRLIGEEEVRTCA